MADAENETTLFHPNIADLTRVRSDPKDIEEHLKAGWLEEDPQVTRRKAAAEEAEKQKRSEAAKKGAKTRQQNASTSGSDQVGDGTVSVVDETPQQ